ncbi:alpha/beta hydrolase-fold protein [Streptomyces sp. R21]|uniref:Alpha/beta hydrolase-fold protein n=1 Tax=Streptomyces sp. R21 TaxID=3238627 RepID=A0AB39P011_9ACTN
MSAPDVVALDHDSACLRGNPLGDPHRRRVEVHLPPGYDETRRYPVIYWLTGYGARPTLTGQALAFGDSPGGLIHRAMADGRVPPALLVVPDCTTAYGGSQFINSATSGRYLDHLAEVVAEVDRRLPTRPDATWRAVAGKSSGGYGALVAAMTTDLFGAALAHSPDAGFEYTYLPLLPRTLDAVAAAGGIDALLARRSDGPHDATFMVAMSIIAMGMCYGDKPGLAPAEALPCDPSTGDFRDEVWHRWLTHDPVRMVPAHRDRLAALRLLYVDVGARDDYAMHWGARALHSALDRHGVRHIYREHEGGHHGIETRFADSLAELTQVWRSGTETR